MRSDRRGDIGFSEAIVAVIVVTMGLVAFIGVSSAFVSSHSDPLEGLDPDSFDAEVIDGTIVTYHHDFMKRFVSSSGASGMSITVSVPGGFADSPVTDVVGDRSGGMFTRSYVSAIDTDGGRTVAAVFEVTVWYRTARG